MKKSVVITGAGSGVGRAVAIKLARSGWQIALVGRSEHTLQETTDLCQCQPEDCRVCPCDITDSKAVFAMAAGVLAKFGNLTALINSAGMNIAKRSLQTVTLEEFQLVLKTNLEGAFNCIQAVLPTMRNRQEGTIVNINSVAGKWASELAGAAYSASKFGLTGLTETINKEERRNGIRACGIFPGEINTPLLDKRPHPPTTEARSHMLQPEDIAECVSLVLNLPRQATIEEILIHPTEIIPHN